MFYCLLNNFSPIRAAFSYRWYNPFLQLNTENLPLATFLVEKILDIGLSGLVVQLYILVLSVQYDGKTYNQNSVAQLGATKTSTNLQWVEKLLKAFTSQTLKKQNWMNYVSLQSCGGFCVCTPACLIIMFASRDLCVIERFPIFGWSPAWGRRDLREMEERLRNSSSLPR